ncbi:MAG: response regulator [Deltaproteobacteria bacterium]|nr:response regulator [Deltaproteobacteria bacterium]
MAKRVLVIDDDPMIRALVKSILEPEGLDVALAEDGLSAIQILDDEPKPIGISLIILDVVMPGMNGLDVLTRLKIGEATQNIPVLMLTGESKAEDIMSGYSGGADYYITKPFTRQQLLYGLNLLFQSDQSNNDKE